MQPLCLLIAACGVLDKSPSSPIDYETYAHGSFGYIAGEDGEEGLFVDLDGNTLTESEFQDSLRTFFAQN